MKEARRQARGQKILREKEERPSSHMQSEELEWYSEWASEITEEDEERRNNRKWFQQQMDAMKERCQYCKTSLADGRSKCWKHNPENCKFCYMEKCERHDEHGRWIPDMNEIMSGRWERKLAREAGTMKKFALKSGEEADEEEMD